MRTGRWRTWLGAGLLAVLGVGRAPAQDVSLPPLTPRPGGLPAQPVAVVTDGGRPMALPMGAASSPPPAPHSAQPFPTALPIDAHGGEHGAGMPVEGGHDMAHQSCGPDCEVGSYEFWGDYLLLKAHRNAQDYAVLSPNLVELPGGTIQSADYETQTGFRIGGGYKLPGDGCLIGITYTYLHTKDNPGVGAPAGGTLYATTTRGGSFDDVTTASAQSDLNYNVLDLDFSKRFTPTHDLDVTVFGGGRLAVIDQKFQATYNGGSMGAVNSQVSAPVYFYGGGLTAGGESIWKIYEGRDHTGMGFYMRARGSLVSGETRNFLTETASNGTISVVNVAEKTHSVIPVAELGFGLSMDWEHLSVRVGYEMTNWFGLVNSPDFPSASNIGTLNRRTSDLSLEGLAVHMGLTF